MNVSKALQLFNKNNETINTQYAVLAIVAYLFFLLYTLPASVVLSFVSLPKNISLSSISGSVWSGRSKEFKFVSPGFEIGTLAWKLHPLNLLVGEVSTDISVTNGEQFVSSEVTLSLSGALKLENTRFEIDMASLQPLTYGMPFSYTGHISGDFPFSVIHKSKHMSVTGQLNLNDVRLMSPQQQLFGDINMKFRAEKEGASSAVIKDSGGPLRLNGQLTLNKNAGVDLSTQISAREAGSSLEQIISILGRKDETGRVHFNSHFQM